MKPRSERDKRYEEKHKNERKAKNNRKFFRFRSFALHARRRSASPAFTANRSGNRRRTQKARKTQQ